MKFSKVSNMTKGDRKKLYIRLSAIVFIGVFVLSALFQATSGLRGFTDVSNFLCRSGTGEEIELPTEFIYDNSTDIDRTVVEGKKGLKYYCLNISKMSFYEKVINPPVKEVLVRGTKKAAPTETPKKETVFHQAPQPVQQITPQVRDNYIFIEEPRVTKVEEPKVCRQETIPYQTETETQYGAFDDIYTIEGKNGYHYKCGDEILYTIQPVNAKIIITKKQFELRDVRYEPVPPSDWKLKPMKSRVNVKKYR